MSKQTLSTIGLIVITILAAIQYIFLQNVPDSVSTFAFLCITNTIGFLLMGILRFDRIRRLKKQTLKKGIVLAIELTGFNFFLLLGSRHLDAVMISSLVSLYFVFITPLLLLLKKKVNFFSAIATVIAVIALLLMFGADTNAMFSSIDVVYLIIADIFFAAYVIGVSILGEGEESIQLSFSQMLFSAIFGLAGWGIECLIAHKRLSLPTDSRFWISAVFIGLFIRGIYGVIQIAAQKHVSELKASLIFASEIIITLITNPIMCRIFHMEYTKATGFQIVGCILFIIATLLVDDKILKKLGYEDMEDTTYVDEYGVTIRKTSVAKKLILTTLNFSMITLIISTVICLVAISFIRRSAVSNSQKLGEDASTTSMVAMTNELQNSMSNQASDKAELANQKLSAYSDFIVYAASYANTLYRTRDSYPEKDVERPFKENAGKWVMQRAFANNSVTYEELEEDIKLLGNMEDIFRPIIENHDNIATIYIGTEDGLLISYDPYSDTASTDGETYYEYRESNWYEMGRKADGYAFTETYQDGYGRGLTITCVAPVKDENGKFCGCVAMDVLMKELNESMINDGIIDPSVATLIDRDGNIIASKDVNPDSEEMDNIFDEGVSPILAEVGEEILNERNGIISSGEGEAARYISYATIDSTDWLICIISPVSVVIEPAIEIRDSIEGNTDNVVAAVIKGILTVIQSYLIVSALILLFVTFMTGKITKRISDPLKTLEEDVRQISAGKLDQRTMVQTNDEIGSLAVSFNQMTDSLQSYIANLKEVTAKEERIAMELSVATNIQASMLPKNFDIDPDKIRFSLFASMDPAKEVGGDFYDFFLIDEDHLGLVIADVSGKGVPAALFMMMSKILLNNYASMGGSPKEILERTNDQICKNNEEDMFVTVWLGIMTISTGKIVAANAGHEYPMIRKPNGDFELFRDKHGFVIGGMEGMFYQEYEFTLEPGGTLFLYTDGVPEATNAEDQLFETDRMLEVLNQNKDAAPKDLLYNMKAAVDEFVGDAEQFDDLTMMAIKLN